MANRTPAITKKLIKSRVKKINKHWIWKGAANSSGYGKLYYMKDSEIKQEYAHRASWLAFYGPIPTTVWFKGKRKRAYVLHKRLCNIKLCCRPTHLYIGTNAQNSLDMHASPVGMYVRKRVRQGAKKWWQSLSPKRRKYFIATSGWRTLTHRQRSFRMKQAWRKRNNGL